MIPGDPGFLVRLRNSLGTRERTLKIVRAKRSKTETTTTAARTPDFIITILFRSRRESEGRSAWRPRRGGAGRTMTRRDDDRVLDDDGGGHDQTRPDRAGGQLLRHRRRSSCATRRVVVSVVDGLHGAF